MPFLSFYLQHNICFVALKLENKVIEKYLDLAPTQTQAMALVPFIEKVWQEAGSPALSCLITPRGPGAFTSLRIGLATAQGFELAFPKACIFSPTHFDVLAYAASLVTENPFIVLIDSKKGDFYGQIFDKELVEAPKVYTYNEVNILLEKDPRLKVMTDLEDAKEINIKGRLIKTDRNLATCQIELYETAAYLRENPEYQKFRPFYMYLPDYVKRQPL